MKLYRVEVRPSALAHLTAIEARIAREANPAIAEAYIETILERCFALDVFADRGTPRDDIRPGLRTLVLRRRVTIAYAVEGDEVAVLGVAWRGQDLERLLADKD